MGWKPTLDVKVIMDQPQSRSISLQELAQTGAQLPAAFSPLQSWPDEPVGSAQPDIAEVLDEPFMSPGNDTTSLDRHRLRFYNLALESRFSDFRKPHSAQRSVVAAGMFAVCLLIWLLCILVGSGGPVEASLVLVAGVGLGVGVFLDLHTPRLPIISSHTLSFLISLITSCVVLLALEQKLAKLIENCDGNCVGEQEVQHTLMVTVYAALLSLALFRWECWAFAGYCLGVNLCFAVVFYQFCKVNKIVTAAQTILSLLLVVMSYVTELQQREWYLWERRRTDRAREVLTREQQAGRRRSHLVGYLFHEIRNAVNTITLACGTTIELLSARAPASAGREVPDADMAVPLPHPTPHSGGVPSTSSQPTSPVSSYGEGTVRDMLDIINEGARSASSLLTDALDLERLAVGSFPFVPIAFQFNELYKPVLLGMQPKIREKAITLNVEIEHDLEDVVVQADVQRLQQVLHNMAGNAVKFSPTRGEILVQIKKIGRVVLDAAPPQTPDTAIGRVMVRVSVSDTGPGVSPEDQEKLFRPFSQIRAAELQGGGGTGLGLSLCKDLVQRGHNGSVGVLSPGLLGSGSTFYFDITYAVMALEASDSGSPPLTSSRRPISPLRRLKRDKRPGPLPDQQTRSNSEQLESNSTPKPESNTFIRSAPALALQPPQPRTQDHSFHRLPGDFSTSTMTIVEGEHSPFVTPHATQSDTSYTADVLVVDDSPTNRALLCRALETLSLSHDSAENGQTALQRVQSGLRYRLVLMDKEMPELDGCETARQMRDLVPDMTIIGVTGDGLPAQKEAFLQSGVSEVIVKPISLTILRDVLQRRGIL